MLAEACFAAVWESDARGCFKGRFPTPGDCCVSRNAFLAALFPFFGKYLGGVLSEKVIRAYRCIRPFLWGFSVACAACFYQVVGSAFLWAGRLEIRGNGPEWIEMGLWGRNGRCTPCVTSAWFGETWEAQDGLSIEWLHLMAGTADYVFVANSLFSSMSLPPVCLPLASEQG